MIDLKHYEEKWVGKGGRIADHLTPEEAKVYFAAIHENQQERQYYEAFELMGMEPTRKWEELTEEERQRVRDENRRYAQEMQDFGNALFKSGQGDDADLDAILKAPFGK